jgi:hypothetical protein
MAMVALLMTAVKSDAQRRDDDDDDNIHYYVVGELRGLDITCSKLTSVVQVNQRVEELKQEKAVTLRANAQLRKEIKELKRKIRALKQLKGRKRTDEEQAEVQQRIDEAEAELKAKEDQVKEVVRWIVKGPFSRSADADAVIDQLEREARQMRLKAEKNR